MRDPLLGFGLDLQLFADQEKTEPATPRRRDEARKKGQLAKTTELGTAVAILAGVAVFSSVGLGLARTAVTLLQNALTTGLAVELTEASIHQLAWQAIAATLTLAGPILAVLALSGIASQVFQVGFFFSGESLKPQWGRLNPVEGFKRLFSRRGFADAARSVVKLAAIVWIAYTGVRGSLPTFPQLLDASPADAVSMVGGLTFKVGMWIGVALLVVALFDYGYQRWEWEQSLRMSRKEVLEEVRESEGDPQIRAQLRRRRRQIASQRMMQAVPTADVVITNPVHYAIALKYVAASMDAPTVIAKGAGLIAQRIKEVARENGVRVVENPPLARALFEAVEVGQSVPAELYQAVAEVLAYVYRLRNGRNKGRGA